MCCSPWGRKESDTPEPQNSSSSTELCHPQSLLSGSMAARSCPEIRSWRQRRWQHEKTHLFRRSRGRPVCTADCGRACVSSRLGGDRAREMVCPPSSSDFLLKTLKPQVSSCWEMECPSVTCSFGIKPGFSEGGVLSGAAAMADGAASSAAKWA